MGNYNLKDILSDEVFLVSYSYNYGEPRFYTKSNAKDKNLKLDYDVSLDFAARASSASPYYFEPVFRSTLRGKQR
jgi:patatin-like phospholipase/acyl hydrolase